MNLKTIDLIKAGFESPISFSKPFWAIVCYGDANGFHTGKVFKKTVIAEFDTAIGLSEYLADGSVEAGESMGEYYFKIIALYSSQEQFDNDVASEKEQKNCEQFNDRWASEVKNKVGN